MTEELSILLAGARQDADQGTQAGRAREFPLASAG